MTYKGAEFVYAAEVLLDLVISSCNVANASTPSWSWRTDPTRRVGHRFAAFLVPDGDTFLFLVRVKPGILADETFVQPRSGPSYCRDQ